jgi:glycolate oxidase iron-sulfur subunit
VQVLAPEVGRLRGHLGRNAARVVFQSPCTLQHAARLGGSVEALLTALGVTLLPATDAAACCGSAGTYSLLQPTLAGQLRERKLAALTAAQPECILSANVGCIAHLAAASAVPVWHWAEWLSGQLSSHAAGADAAAAY